MSVKVPPRSIQNCQPTLVAFLGVVIAAPRSCSLCSSTAPAYVSSVCQHSSAARNEVRLQSPRWSVCSGGLDLPLVDGAYAGPEMTASLVRLTGLDRVTNRRLLLEASRS